MEEIKINTEYIKLGQLLKLASLISQGSDAKIYLSEGLVKVNNIKTVERGKKIRNNDIVEVEGIGKVKVISEN